MISEGGSTSLLLYLHPPSLVTCPWKGGNSGDSCLVSVVSLHREERSGATENKGVVVGGTRSKVEEV